MFRCWQLLVCVPVVVFASASATAVGAAAGSVWSDDPSWSRRSSNCVAIPADLRLCQAIGYDKMRLPNLLEHDSLAEVRGQSEAWIPLIHTGCHRDAKIFLCSLFTPVCLDRPIFPCRSLCESVRGSCEGAMMAAGYKWPEMLACKQYPTDNQLCIGPRNVNQKSPQCPSCKTSPSERAILRDFCSADFAMKVKVREHVIFEGEVKIEIERKKKLLKTGPLKPKQLRKPSLFMKEGSSSSSLSSSSSSSSSSPSPCDCGPLEENNSTYKLVMGSVGPNGRLYVSHVSEFVRGRQLKRALKKIRADTACRRSKGGKKNRKGAKDGARRRYRKPRERKAT